MNKPAHHPHVIPYLMVRDPEGFRDFLEHVFGASHEGGIHRDDTGRILHAEAMIGTGCVMYSQAIEQWPESPAGMYIYVEDADATYARAMERGSASVMEMANQSYGRTGGVRDPYGNTWWITTP